MLEIACHLPVRFGLRLKRRWSASLFLSLPCPHPQQCALCAGGQVPYYPFYPDIGWVAVDVGLWDGPRIALMSIGWGQCCVAGYAARGHEEWAFNLDLASLISLG